METTDTGDVVPKNERPTSFKARLMKRISVAVGKKKRQDGAGSPRSVSSPKRGENSPQASPDRKSSTPQEDVLEKNIPTLDQMVKTEGENIWTQQAAAGNDARSNNSSIVDAGSSTQNNDNMSDEQTTAPSAVSSSAPTVAPTILSSTEGATNTSSAATATSSAPVQPSFTTGLNNDVPSLPPNKPKPRGSMLGRMRRASRGAMDLLSPSTREAPSNAQNTSAPAEEEYVHPKQAGGIWKAFSGRKLNFQETKSIFATGASASGSSAPAPTDASVVRTGTVKSLISQTNTNSANNGSAKIGKSATTGKSTPAAAKSVKFDDKASSSKTPGIGARTDESRSSNGKPGFKLDESSTDTKETSKGAPGKAVKFDDRAASSSGGAVGKSPGSSLSSARLKTTSSGVKLTAETDEKTARGSSAGSRHGSQSQRLAKRSVDLGKKMSRKSLSKYRSTAGVEGLELSLHEQAFMPGDLLKRLGASAGQLPPAPSVFAGQGAVLFVDVSGFTKLAERLNKDNVPVKASEKLANTITRVLEVLAQVCLDNGGEVGKFAGDALLCVWESNDLTKAELLAKHCAVQMLIEMENLNRIEKVELQIHGGVAKGSIVHFHFGSSDDDLRWYLVSGEAVAAATTLVDVANAGEFCCQDGVAKGLPSIMDESDLARPTGLKGFKIARDLESGNVFSTFRGFMNSSKSNGGASAAASNAQADEPKHTKSLARGKKEIPTTFLASSSDLPARPDFPPEHSNVASVLKDGLPRSCNVYIPASLRDQLNERSEKKGEMRRRIAVMFVEISTLVMTEDELLKQTVSDAKLDSLNSAFVTMTRIVHAFEGEVRDMLFDDKGCVYIAIFGAHCEEEKEHHPWNLLAVKAAMAIVNEVPSARVGVSIGTCFVGMAGVIERRTDFVVVGHEVNMAARYMSNARPGQVLVSSGIHGSTKEQVKYGPEIHIMVGKGEYAKQRTVYSPLEESHRRASFQASYRRSMGGAGLFVGRQNEIQLIEGNMNKITNGRSGVMVIEAPPGRGKSSIVTRAKRMGRGKIKVVSGQALSTERNSPYFAFRQVLEAYTGIRPAMTSQECRAVLDRLEGGKGEKINVQALGQVLPWINDSLSSSAPAPEKNKSMAPDRVADAFLQIIKLTLDRNNEKSALIVLEDVQWMDKESLEMLHRLIDGLEKIQKVAILMTLRSDLIDDSNGNAFEAMEYSAYADEEEAKRLEPVRKELIATLKAKAKKLKFNSLWIELQPLPKNDANTLAAKWLGGEPNELTAQKLWDQAKGDPFYLELLVQWLQERNMIRPEKSGTVTVACDPSAFPKTVEELIHARCTQLSEEHKRILQLAASGGELFDAVYISAVSKALATAESKPSDSLSTDQVLGGLHAAADLELLTHITDNVLRDEAQHKWKFKHDLIYRAIWLQISAPRRLALDRAAQTDRKKLGLRLKSSFFETKD